MDIMMDSGNNFLITTVKGDVTGDGVPDTVYLTGYKEKPADIFIRNITLVIEDGKTGRLTPITFKNNAGYNPRIFLGDFTKDNVLDILISIDSGGSGGFGFYYIFSAKNGEVRKIFDNDEFNQTYRYDVIFRDNCQVAVYSQFFKKTYLIDVSYKKDFYMEQGVYDRACKLLKPVTGFVPGLNNLYPLETTEKGSYNLLAVQRVIGLFGADTLGYIETTLEWNGRTFVPIAERISTPSEF